MPTLTAARATAGFIPATGDEGIGQRGPPPLFIVPAARSTVKVKLPQAAVAACLVPQQVTGAPSSKGIACTRGFSAQMCEKVLTGPRTGRLLRRVSTRFVCKLGGFFSGAFFPRMDRYIHNSMLYLYVMTKAQYMRRIVKERI